MSDEKAVVRYDANKPAGTSATLAGLLERPEIQNSLAKIAPRHLSRERVAKIVLIAVSRNPLLLQCTQGSLLKAVMTSVELGLDCSGTLGRGYLIPFKNNKIGAYEAIFIPGYLGLIDLARNSGDVQSVMAEVVYKDDEFRMERGLVEVLEHKPNVHAEKRDEDIVGAYMIARFKDGGHHFDYMTRQEIEAIRARSRARDSGPWRTDYAAMCKKTVIRRGIKYCPLSIEAQQAISKTDEEFDHSTAWKPDVAEAKLSLEDLSAGDVETHIEVDAEVQQEAVMTCSATFEAFIKAHNLNDEEAGKIASEIKSKFGKLPKNLPDALSDELWAWLNDVALETMVPV